MVNAFPLAQSRSRSRKLAATRAFTQKPKVGSGFGQHATVRVYSIISLLLVAARGFLALLCLLHALRSGLARLGGLHLLHHVRSHLESRGAIGESRSLLGPAHICTYMSNYARYINAHKCA
jgi:hypothetical protein